MNFRGTPLQNEDYEPLREATATGVQTSELREPAPLTPDEILWKEVEARGLVSGRFDPKSFPKLPARTLSSGDYPFAELLELPKDLRDCFRKTLRRATGLFLLSPEINSTESNSLWSELRVLEIQATAPSDVSSVVCHPIRDYHSIQQGEVERHMSLTSIWAQLLEETEKVRSLQGLLGQLSRTREEVSDLIRRELETASEELPLRSQMNRVIESFGEGLQQLEAERSELNAEIVRQTNNLSAYTETLDRLRPFAESRQYLRWWTIRFWKSLFRKDLMPRWQELQKQKAETETRIQDLQELLQKAEKSFEEKKQAEQQEIARLFEQEISERCRVRDQKLSELQNQIDLANLNLDENWRELSKSLNLISVRPRSVEELRIYQQPTSEQLQQSLHESIWAENWQKRFQELPETVKVRRALSSGHSPCVSFEFWQKHLRSDRELAQMIDGVVLKGIPALSVQERAELCDWCDRVIWMEPEEIDRNLEGANRVSRAVDKAGSFASVWNIFDQRRWKKQGGRLIATLEFTSEFHRNRLELESLADNSDIQLAILPPERGATARLVEVRFPENFPLVEAKRILLEELQTILIHTSSPGYCLEATEDMFLLRFTESAWDASLCLSKGICEKLTGLETSAISFEKRAGWNVHSIQSWMNLNLPGRKVSRVFCLETGCNSL
ncbi:hypothetical protein KIH39_01145 [Telmatocola sphagniphila]|uniref:Uncharacterized protein n=1 Tax=Telmatocola sphagniphila TaxID=1123043 RepID=A0A8E6B8N0_9BACT|nr:hypothetical protein [Telmatocola sphagniphila]QVL32553.1 hypothetical protein KIH39_01145 [Telmatocola sphagniphila]